MRRRFVMVLPAALLLGGVAPVQRHLRAAGLLARLADPSARSPLLPDPRRVEESDLTFPGPGSAPVAARLYRPVGVARPPGMVVLHGVHRLGIEDPRLATFARALASAGVLVMTPQIRPLAEYRIDTEGEEIIGDAILALAQRDDVAPGGVGLVGMSFAGGLALLAAADSRFAPRVKEVLAVGAYDDLERVSRFLATDQAVPADGPSIPLVAHEYGALVLAHSHPEDFFEPADVEVARGVLRSWLREEKEAAMQRSKELSPTGQRELDHLLHDRAALRPQLLASIAKHAAELAAASPRGQLRGLRAPVFLLHGAGDTVIPPTEVGWIARDLPQGTLQGELVTPLLEHVSLKGAPSVSERWEAVHFLAEVLAQE